MLRQGWSSEFFFLQEFKIEIKDKKKVDNMTVDHS